MTAEPDLLPEPKFGDWLRGIYASESNPTRDGMYVRTIRRSGRINPGKYYEVTDGNGKFWKYPAQSTERIDRANVAHATAAKAAEIEALRAEVGSERRLRIREEGLSRAWKARADFAEKGLNECAGRAARAEHRAERLAEALQRLVNSFPEEGVLLDAGWDGCEVDEACEAYDAARALLREQEGK